MTAYSPSHKLSLNGSKIINENDAHSFSGVLNSIIVDVYKRRRRLLAFTGWECRMFHYRFQPDFFYRSLVFCRLFMNLMRCPYCARPLKIFGTYCRACRRYILRWTLLAFFGLAIIIILFLVLQLLSE